MLVIGFIFVDGKNFPLEKKKKLNIKLEVLQLERNNHMHHYRQGLTAMKQLCGEGPGRPCRQQAVHGREMPLWPKMPILSWDTLRIELPGG